MSWGMSSLSLVVGSDYSRYIFIERVAPRPGVADLFIAIND
jgi:hypothetical protein